MLLVVDKLAMGVVGELTKRLVLTLPQKQVVERLPAAAARLLDRHNDNGLNQPKKPGQLRLAKPSLNTECVRPATSTERAGPRKTLMKAALC